MRFDTSGKSLWWGTADAPAPEGTVVAGADRTADGVTVTLGVSPLNASYRVEIHYRINGGPLAKIPAVLFRTDVRAGAQYFSARLPHLRYGDKVEYSPECACGSVHIPHAGPPRHFPSFFHVVDAATHRQVAPPAHVAPSHSPQVSLHTQHHGSVTAAHPQTHQAAHIALHPIPIVGPPIHTPSGHGNHRVEGLVSSPGHGPLSGMLVEIVDKNSGPHVSLATAITDEHGRYHANYTAPPKKAKPDICARVFAGQTLLGVSHIRYNASLHENLSVVIPANAKGLPSEYESLTASLNRAHAGRLAELRESGDREDVTYLAKKTGWDARAIVFAAVADRFTHAKGGGALAPAFYYALFRAGFSMEPDALYASSPASVAEAWRHSVSQGVIPNSLAGSIDAATRTFQALCASHALEEKPTIGLSSLKELLQITLGADARRMEIFAQAHIRHKHDQTAFWKEVEAAFGADSTRRLQFDGQLAHLTLNNAPLLAALHKMNSQTPLVNVDDLAARGLYQAEKWMPLIGGAIPKEIKGDTPDHRRGRYAEYLAAQVRLAAPNAVLAEMIATEALPLSPRASKDDRAGVLTFLKEHHSSFSIGGEPIERYFAHHLSAAYSPSVVREIKRLQRVYQITPNDHAFAALLRLNLDSAYAITRYDSHGFVQAFAKDLGGHTIASQVHAKARVVAGAALQIATSRLAARGPHAHVAALTPSTTGSGGGLVVSPTMETLFGSLDFCDCPECRSVLSPAAYLVDLLNFIDYPPAGKRNPQTVLLHRRPDLQHLPLTCENTNVALPYIDLVNETLEHFVAHRLTLHDYHGHTTRASISSEELCASPQFVEDSAYATLKNALFPIKLPFNRPLEQLRFYFQTLGQPLWSVMAAFARQTGEEDSDKRRVNNILMERVGLSQAEHRLFTDDSLSLGQIYGFSTEGSAPSSHHKQTHGRPDKPQKTGAPQAHEHDVVVMAELSNFQHFCRRVGISYGDLDAIVRTRYVNPDIGVAARVEALGLSFDVLQLFKAGAIPDEDFKELLPADLDPVAFGAHNAASKHDFGPVFAWIRNETNYARIMGLIIVAKVEGSDETCSASNLRLGRANPDPARHQLSKADFVRMLRFVRLWRKLGLSIELTDAVLSALLPNGSLYEQSGNTHVTRSEGAAFATALSRLGYLLQVADLLSLTLERDLQSLLACWAPIETHGRKSLYRKMFLSPSLLHKDAVFSEDPSGEVLPGDAKLLEHEPALCSALHLRGPEFKLIAEALRFDEATPLTLEKVTEIYRHGWLARSLRISVIELLALIECTGLNPFAPLDPDMTGAKEATNVLREPPMLRFIRLALALRNTSLKPAQALYLFWNRDISGKSAPPERLVNDLARALRANFQAVDSQFTLVDDPKGEIAKSLMALVYGSEATEFFFSLLEGTLGLSVPYAAAQHELSAAVSSASGGRLIYDDLRKLLSFKGVLGEKTPLPEITAAAAGDEALQKALASLAKKAHRVVDPFFVSNPSLSPLYKAYVASTDSVPLKRKVFLREILKDLKPRRKEEQALTTVAAGAGTDTNLAATLLRDKSVLSAAAEVVKPGLADFTALDDCGLSVRIYSGNDLAGHPDHAEATAPFPYTRGRGPKESATSEAPLTAVWSGFVDPPKTGFYDIAVVTDAAAVATVEIDGVAITMAQGPDGWSNQTPISLTAGAFAAISLTVRGLKSELSVRWTTEGLAWQPIPAACLYSKTLLERLRISYVRFLKAAALGAALSLTAKEVAYLAADPDFQQSGKGWLNVIMTGTESNTAEGRGLTEVLVGVLEFASIKAALSPTDESLLAILFNPEASLPDGGSALLALTQWEQTSLTSLLLHFFKDKKLTHLRRFENFRRVFDAYKIISSCGLSTDALLKAATNDPTPDNARILEAALRAKYEDADWLTLIKPINDKMRILQRDALVAYTLHHLADRPETRSINTPERLFEYLLMDVEMAPCGQTSRIRLALSSIQLFIERVLRHLEPAVDPSHIPAAQWEWMKRYRIWQANREIFLWPENWLDPELRDDQSPFFKETLGELLQGDLTEDGAATAFSNYLNKLHDIAKLEPCGLCHVPNDVDAANAVTHVFARTAGLKRKYYYRRRQHGGWSAWEEIKIAIEDNPVTPILWNNRLILLWVQIIKQSPPPLASGEHEDTPPEKPKDLKFDEIVHWGKAEWANWRASVERYNAYQRAHKSHQSSTKLNEANIGELHQSAKSTAGDPEITIQAVLCWSEYRNGKWTSANTSDVNAPALLGDYPPHGPNAFDRSHLRLRAVVRHDGALLVQISHDSELDAAGAGFLLYNTHSAPTAIFGVRGDLLHAGIQRHASVAASTLRIEYKGASRFTRSILKGNLPGAVVECQPGSPRPWEAPFIYEDSRNVFFVTSEERRQPLKLFRGFGFSHPSGLAHGGVAHHFSPLVTPHQSFHLHSSSSATVHYDGVTIGPFGGMHGGTHQPRRRR